MTTLPFPAGTPMLEAAEWYTANGVPVFPLRPGTKKGYAGVRFENATLDMKQFRVWFEQEPELNLAIAPVGFNIVDVDSLPLLPVIFKNTRLEDVLSVRTRRGFHLYFRDFGVRGKYKIRPDGQEIEIEYVGAGQIIVAPPSLVSGHRYEWGLFSWPS